jgi:hypothetical protein
MNSELCQLEGCEKIFEKQNGIRQHSRWYCSKAHADSDPASVKQKEIALALSEAQEKELKKLAGEDEEIDL